MICVCSVIEFVYKDEMPLPISTFSTLILIPLANNYTWQKSPHFENVQIGFVKKYENLEKGKI